MFVSAFCVVLFCAFLGVTLFLLRLIAVLRTGADCKPAKKGSVCVLIVVGSGGHTTEILRLMGSLSQSYTPRHYVMADTDKMSEEKIRTFEALEKKSSTRAQFTIHRIPRSREVSQSWSSSVLSSLYAQLYSLPLVFRLRPDILLCNWVCADSYPTQTERGRKFNLSSVVLEICPSQIHFSGPQSEWHIFSRTMSCETGVSTEVLVLCNGPGTCIPLCTAGLLLGILGLKRVLLLYVESICRVESLSLSGKILYLFADYFFVQWKALQTRYPKSIYIGRIV